MEPCTRLRDLGMTACEKNIGVEESFEEPNRDFKSFGRRESELPMQKEDDEIDLRNILHRDGSVLSAVTPAMLAGVQVHSHPHPKRVSNLTRAPSRFRFNPPFTTGFSF